MHQFTHSLTAAFLEFITLLFAIGGIGCVIVLMMTFWEDVRTIAGH